jgi:hypothetical protein
MARIWIFGNETRSSGTTSTLASYQLVSTTATFSAETTVVHSGGASLKIDGSNGSFAAKPTYSKTTYFSRSFFRFEAAPGANSTVIQFVTASSATLSILMTTGRQLEVRNGTSAGTLLGTSTTALSTNTWYMLEEKAVIHASAGILELHISDTEGTPVENLNFSGLNTTGGGSAITGVAYGQRAASMVTYWDDVTEDDAAYPGYAKIIGRSPSTGGTPTYDDWTKSSGTDAGALWDDTPYNATDSAVSTGANAAQTAQIGDFNTTQTGKGTETIGTSNIIKAAMTVIVAKRGSGQARTHSIRRRYNSTDTDTGVTLLQNADSFFQGTPFASPTLTLLNSMELGGLKAGASSGQEMTIEDVWVMVEYAPNPTYTKTHTTGSLKRKVSTKTHTTDSWLQPYDKLYTREDKSSLPTDDANLATGFNQTDYDDVGTNNSVRVTQSANNYAVFLFKDKNTGGTPTSITIDWDGQSSLAPTGSTVFLQVYNRDTTTWETLDSDDFTGVDTDFILTGTISSGISDYLDTNDFITCRVYQQKV